MKIEWRREDIVERHRLSKLNGPSADQGTSTLLRRERDVRGGQASDCLDSREPRAFSATWGFAPYPNIQRLYRSGLTCCRVSLAYEVLGHLAVLVPEQPLRVR